MSGAIGPAAERDKAATTKDAHIAALQRMRDVNSKPGTTGPSAALAKASASAEVHAMALQQMREFREDEADTVGEMSMSPKPTASPGRLGALPKHLRSPKRTAEMKGTRSPSSLMASPFIICESGGTVFGFTLRKAEGFSLGLNVESLYEERALRVENVSAGGAIHAWNQQCSGGESAGKAIMPGDRIVKVNNARTPDDMLKECKDRQLLKFTVVRGKIDDGIDLDNVGAR
jgi:hypothetical protein